MIDFYLWASLALLIVVVGLGIFFREWLYVIPREKEKYTGKKLLS